MNHRLRILPARADRISLSLGLSLRKHPAIRISTNHRGLGLEEGKPLLAPENLPSPIPFSRSAMEGFTAEELDFILNYDVKYRLGRSSESEED